MPRDKYQGLLKIASEQVPFGIYAIEKGDYAELHNDRLNSMTELKDLRRKFKRAEYKVYANGI